MWCLLWSKSANGCLTQLPGITMTVNQLPSAGLEATDTSLCVGQNVTFTASGGSQFEFFVNGTSVQGPSGQNTYFDIKPDFW